MGRRGLNRMIVDCEGGGSATADLDEPRCEIVWYKSHPRRRGYGRAALPHVEAALWDSGCREILLDPNTRASERFWKKVGYSWGDVGGFRVMVKKR